MKYLLLIILILKNIFLADHNILINEALINQFNNELNDIRINAYNVYSSEIIYAIIALPIGGAIGIFFIEEISYNL
jgi:hypothetical protein